MDFAKAFDMVDQDFLLELLKAKGFGDRWIGWIESMLVTSKSSILVNGLINGYVGYRRGLRQCDLLSLLRFILTVDVLSTMFSNALSSGVLYGVPLDDVGKIY